MKAVLKILLLLVLSLIWHQGSTIMLRDKDLRLLKRCLEIEDAPNKMRAATLQSIALNTPMTNLSLFALELKALKPQNSNALLIIS